jgi:hypothetical protein
VLRVLTSPQLAEALLDEGAAIDFWPWLRDRANDAERIEAIQAEMQLVYARIANMITVQSGVLSVIARGRTLDTAVLNGSIPDDAVLAERVVELLFDRTR